MGFQAVVKTDPAVGIAGQEVNPKQAVYTAFNYVSDGTVQAGTFCFATALKGNVTGETNIVSLKGNVTGETNIVSLKGTSGAKPVGFVERDVIATIPTLTADASQVYPQGACPPIAIRGQFYAVATGAVTEGQSVLCDPATGAITYGAAGTTNDTGWRVIFPRGVKSAAKDDVVIYQNFGVTVATGAMAAALADSAKVDEASAG